MRLVLLGTKNLLMLHGGVGGQSQHSGLLDTYAKESILMKSALDAVVNSVVKMEDNPIFNAGTGSYMRIDGSIQMDAAVMTESGLGSVIAVEKIKNPVLLARDVMEKTPHLIMSGDGAIRLARFLGYPEYNPVTDKAIEQMEKYRFTKSERDVDNERYRSLKAMGDISPLERSTDTVGAVAYINGKFAAAVSTGGATPMLRGRVGDSPLPGSGIYCGNKGAVVATGYGEEIIKHLLCYRVYERIGSDDLSNIMQDLTADFKGPVGLIAVSATECKSYSNKPMPVGYFERNE